MDWSPSDGSEVDSHRIGLDPIEFDWIELELIEFAWIDLDQLESKWIGVDQFESEWIGLDQFESEWIGLSEFRPVPVRTEPEAVYTVSPALESGLSSSLAEHLRTNPRSGTQPKPVFAESLELIRAVLPVLWTGRLPSAELAEGNHPFRPVSALFLTRWRLSSFFP